MKFDKGSLLFGTTPYSVNFIIKAEINDVQVYYFSKNYTNILKYKDDDFINWKVYKNGEFVNEI